MFGIGGTELVIILLFGFLIFGPEKLPQMGRTVGRAIRQFRDASEAANQKFKEEVYDPFKDAVEPYAEEIKEQGAPLKEDIDAINKTFKETQEMFKDPFGLQKEDASSAGAASTSSASGPAGAANVHSAAGSAGAAGANGAGGSTDQSGAAGKPKPEGQPLPDTGGTVKKSMAASLYGLDTSSDEEGGE